MMMISKAWLLSKNFGLRGLLSVLPVSIKFGFSYTYYRCASIFHLFLVNKFGYSRYIKIFSRSFIHNSPPVSNKAELSLFNKNYLHSLRKSKSLYITSGGTTGVPSGFYTPPNYHRKFAAFRHSLWSHWGFNPNAPSILLNYSFSPELIRYNWKENGIDINILSIDSALSRHLDLLLSFRPKYLVGYPSTIMRLIAVLNKDTRRIFESLDLIILGSEKLYPYQKNRINDFFSVPLYSWYGSSECIGMAFQCKKSSRYHFLPNVGYMNIEDTGSNRKFEGQSELIFTGLTNRITNFNHWHTGDLYMGYANDCPACGFKGQTVDDIVGRSQDYVIAKDGSHIFASDFNTHTIDFSNLAFYQIIQTLPGEVTVRYACVTNSRHGLTQLKSFIDSKFGALFSVNYEMCDAMLTTPKGKSPFIFRIS